MIDPGVGEYEKREIDAQIARILRDLGNPSPPLILADVRNLLKLNLSYYRSTDPSIIQELTHRFTLFAKKTLPDVGQHLRTALAKSKLTAFWVPSSQQILLDETVPEPKHRWIESHEITHSVTDWHKEFLLGDNDNTVDPACHAIIEAEANYGAGRLLFFADRFTHEARDLPLTFDSVKKMAKRYENSIVSTFWRMVETRHIVAFGMVSNHPRHPDVGKHDGEMPWRYFIRSTGFRQQFENISSEEVYALITKHCTGLKRGPIFQADDALMNAIGESWEFHIECFSTTHAVLTFGYVTAKRVQGLHW